MCKLSVAIFTAVQFVAMLPINIAEMCVLFTQVNKMFNQNHLAAKARRMARMKRLAERK
jgi:hypothetical protein